MRPFGPAIAKVSRGAHVYNDPDHRENDWNPTEQHIDHRTDVNSRHFYTTSTHLLHLLAWNIAANLLRKPDPYRTAGMHAGARRRVLLNGKA